MFRYYRRHQGQFIIIGIALAFPLAIFFPSLFKSLSFVSASFISLLKLCALPIIFTSLVVTLGSMRSHHQIKIVARNSILYIVLTEIIAVTIGLCVFNSVPIGESMNARALLHGAVYTPVASSAINIDQIFHSLIPSNIIETFVKFDILPLVLFSVIFGLACSFHPVKSKPVLDVFSSVRDIFMVILNAVMLIAPMAIFVLIGSVVTDGYLNGTLNASLTGLLRFVGLFFGALFLHFLWQLLLVIFLYRHLSLKKILFEAIPIFVTAFISSSSLATLPIAMEKAEKLGGNKKVVEFMLPICASMNFASGMMYEVTAAMFFLQVLGIPIDIWHQVLLAAACILTGMAAGGIPETSMVSFIAIFNMMHIPLSAIGVLMPLDRIVDRVRTMVNIFGNTCGTLVVSKTLPRRPPHLTSTQ